MPKRFSKVVPKKIPTPNKPTPRRPAPNQKLVAEVKPPALPSQELALLENDILQLLASAHAGEVQARAEVGKRLIEVKVSLKHGEWLPWLGKSLPLTPSTAKRAIQLHHFREKHPGVFGQLAKLGLTKAYHLMTLSAAERDAFIGQSHWVPSANAKKTPLQMTFAQMMEVLHPPKPQTKKETTTKTFRTLRRQVGQLSRILSQLLELAPSVKRSPALKRALSVLEQEVDQLGDQLAGRSLIAYVSPSYS